MDDKKSLDEFVFEINVKLNKGDKELDCSDDLGREDLDETIELKDFEEQIIQEVQGDKDAR